MNTLRRFFRRDGFCGMHFDWWEAFDMSLGSPWVKR